MIEIGDFFPKVFRSFSDADRRSERERNIITCRFISLDAPRVLREQNKLDQEQFSFLILCDNENTTSQIGNEIELVSLSHSVSSAYSICVVMCQGHRCI